MGIRNGKKTTTKNVKRLGKHSELKMMHMWMKLPGKYSKAFAAMGHQNSTNPVLLFRWDCLWTGMAFPFPCASSVENESISYEFIFVNTYYLLFLSTSVLKKYPL